MYIIVVGCGRLGSALATELSDAGHNISVVDRDSKKFELLGSGFNGLNIKGIEYDNDVLQEAGIAHADYLLSLTPDDNLNIMVSLIAKECFSVPRIISRVNEFSKQNVYELMEIETINPTELISYLIKSKIEENEK